MTVDQKNRDGSVTASRLRKAELGLGIVLTVVMLWLYYVAAASGGGLWRDEANTVGLATLPTVSDVWRNLQYDSFPLLWVLIVRCFSAAFGPMNDPAFRALGILIGAGTVGVLWFSARTFGHSVPLLSLALYAMSPSVIRWGGSMRAYGLGMLLILLTGALMWRFVERPSAGRFAAVTVAAVASVHILYYNAVVLLAFCAGAAAVCAANRARKTSWLVMLIGAVSALSLTPYVSTIRDASSWNILVQIPIYNFSVFKMKLDETLGPAGSWVLLVWFELLLLALAYGARALLAPRWLNLPEKRRDVVVFSLVVLGVGVPAMFVFLRTLSYHTAPWYYLSLVALAGVHIDALFGALIGGPVPRIARLTFVALFSALTFVSTRNAVTTRLTNVDLIARRLERLAAPGDIVIVNSWHYGVSFKRYYGGAADWTTVPPLGFHRFHRYDLLLNAMTAPDQVAPVQPIIARASEALRGGHRVFLAGGLRVPPRGQRPLVLPPAPPEGNWSEPMYEYQWSMMVGDFLRRHAVRVVTVPVPVSRPVSKYENLSLQIVEGWRQ